MDLDKRIKNNHRPLCVIDIKWAMGFIGKNGFFADAINCFENLSECQSGLLISVKDKKLHPFECDNQWHYTFFIPEEWVQSKEEPKTKYRPFTMNEFKATFNINKILTLRRINEPDNIYTIVYLGYRQYDESDNEKNHIYLTNGEFSLKGLFNNFEIYSSEGWHPFGIKE